MKKSDFFVFADGDAHPLPYAGPWRLVAFLVSGSDAPGLKNMMTATIFKTTRSRQIRILKESGPSMTVLTLKRQSFIISSLRNATHDMLCLPAIRLIMDLLHPHIGS